MAPDGVFLADRKVADLPQVLEQIGRHDVADIKTAKVGSNALGCVLTGYFLGGFAGGVAGGYIGGAVSRDKDAGFMRGMVVGMPIGGILVYRTCRHRQWFLNRTVGLGDMDRSDRILACLKGIATGDAIGKQTDAVPGWCSSMVSGRSPWIRGIATNTHPAVCRQCEARVANR